MSLNHPLLYAAIMVGSIFGSESNLVIDMEVNPWYFDENYGMDLVNLGILVSSWSMDFKTGF